jgi:acyl dehydratase
MADAIRFDDLDAINALASEEFGEFGDAIEVTQEMIQGFADLTGDHQWIHVDVERAKAESPFGAPIAHGFLTLSLLPSLIGGGPVKVAGQSAAVNYGAESLRFLSPVPSGSKVHARTRLVGAAAKSGGTLLTTEADVRVVGAEKPAIIYKMQVLYR